MPQNSQMPWVSPLTRHALALLIALGGPSLDHVGVAAHSGWSGVLMRLDHRRDAAWSAGRPGTLDRVFVPGSAALRSDRTLLTGYDRRSIGLRGVQVRYLRVRAVGYGAGWVDLRTLDVVTVRRATDDRGRSLSLPVDLPSRHLIRLRQTPAGWRVASVEQR